MINKTVTKTRNLSVFQLFEILQEEYVVCELRAKIYPHQKHKDYWSDTMQKKKEKILDIAHKNSLPCLFDNENLKNDFINRIIPEMGFPKFLYKDEHQKLMQEKWDIHNYYLPNSEVKVLNEVGDIIFGVIIYADLVNKQVKIQIKDTNKSDLFDIETVTRVL